MTERPINPIPNQQKGNEPELENKDGQNKTVDINSLSADEIVDLIYNKVSVKNLNIEVADKFLAMYDEVDFYGSFIVEHIDCFEEKNHPEIVNKLIEKGYGQEVCENFEKFKNLNNTEVSNKLADRGEGYYVIVNIEKFNDIDQSYILNKAIDKHPWTNYSSAKEIPQEILNKLSILRNLDISVANKLTEHGEEPSLASNLKSFGQLDLNIAKQLIVTKQDSGVIDNLEKFNGLTQANLADMLIKLHRGNKIILNIRKFSDLSHTKIANKLIDNDQVDYVVDALTQHLGLENLDMTIANKLLDLKKEDTVIRSLHCFVKFDSSTVNRLIDVGYGNNITYYFQPEEEEHYPFQVLDSSVAMNLIDHGQGEDVIFNPEFFKDLKEEDIIDKILETEHNVPILRDARGFLENLKEFNPNISPDIIKYIEDFQSRDGDSSRIYRLRNQFSLKELMTNYDHFRIKFWEEDNNLNPEDKEIFEKLRDFINEDTLGKLWRDHRKEDLHIIGPKIIRIFELTGSQPDTFRGQFLERIINDGSSYDGELKALSYFSNIVENLNEDTNSVLNEAISFEKTRPLVEQLQKDGPFKNWETLKKYYELSEILKQREVLEKLENLKKDGKEKQYKFFSDLAFHPGSKISMQTVFKFMEDPAHFLDVEDEHSREAHERKKPSNYTKFNYLDISAEDLRDALIEGNLDKLQYFKPFEARYKIATTNYTKQEIVPLLKDALGSYSEKIQGNAKNPGKLFKITQEILKKYNIDYKDLINNPDLLQGDIFNELEAVLFDKNFGIKDERKFDDYLVKIHPKSSPEGHLAGNDTACCMPFGSGKNNVYMYNLGCSILTVQRKVGDKYRTIAQSVLTPDVDIKHSISDLVNKVQDETLLSSVIKEDLTQKKNIIITADNIEIAPNSDKYKNVIEKIYSDFVSRYAHDLDLNEVEKDRMLIGKGYSDLSFSKSKEIDNTFIPITPVAYSDNYGEKVYELPLPEKSEIVPLPNYGMLQKIEKEEIDPDLPKGVSYLNAHDTLRVSYMEGKVYAENESLVQYIHRIGNELTAKDINNSFKDRPNLSFKVEDDGGAMLGYMVAYEGVDDKEKVIYISDLAADVSKSKLTGGRLIKAFKDIIKREYLDKGNLIPILMEARESTSYQIIQSQLSDESRKNPDKNYGYKFEIEENGSEKKGGENLYYIKLIPVKIEE